MTIGRKADATIIYPTSVYHGEGGYLEAALGTAVLFKHGKPRLRKNRLPGARIVVCAVWCPYIDRMDKFDHEELAKGGFLVPVQSRACPALERDEQHFIHC